MPHLNSHTLEIMATDQAKSLWITTRVRVYINGLLQAESPNSWNRGKGSLEFVQTDNNVQRNYRVEFDGRFLIAHVAYKVYIDDDLYTTGKVLPTNWYMLYLLVFAGLTLSLIL